MWHSFSSVVLLCNIKPFYHSKLETWWVYKVIQWRPVCCRHVTGGGLVKDPCPTFVPLAATLPQGPLGPAGGLQWKGLMCACSSCLSHSPSLLWSSHLITSHCTSHWNFPFSIFSPSLQQPPPIDGPVAGWWQGHPHQPVTQQTCLVFRLTPTTHSCPSTIVHTLVCSSAGGWILTTTPLICVYSKQNLSFPKKMNTGWDF